MAIVSTSLFVSVLSLLALYGLLGWRLSILLFVDGGKPSDLNRYAVALSAPIIGYLGFSLLVYALSSTLGVGIRNFALPLLVVAVLAACFANLRGPRLLLASTPYAICNTGTLLCAILLAWALASFHVWYPLVLNNWEMAYSIGNDSARYLAMIQHIQNAPWIYGSSLIEPLHYPFGNRPLMHYQQALPVALLSTTPYLAYSVSSIINTCLTFNAIVLLAVLSYRRFSYLGVALVAVTIGFAGALSNYYYSGFVGHYFSVLSIFFCLTSLYWVSPPKVRLPAGLVTLAAVAASYSIGFAILSAVLLYVGWIATYLSKAISRSRFLYETFALVGALVIITLIFRHELVVGSGFSLTARNASYLFEFPKSVLVYSGIVSKWQDPAGLVYYTMWSILVAACVFFTWRHVASGTWILRGVTICLTTTFFYAAGQYNFLDKSTGLFRYFVAYSLLALVVSVCILLVIVTLYAWKRRTETIAWPVIYLAFSAFAIGLYLTGNYYLFNKHSILFLPMILVICFAMTTDSHWLMGFGRILTATILLVFCYFGYVTLTTFHMEIAKSRKSYIDPIAIKSVDALHGFLGETGTIYSADVGSERNLLMRVLYADYKWIPVGDKDILPEYGLTHQEQLQRIAREMPKVVFAAKDFGEPQWAGYQDRSGDIFDGGWFGLYKNTGVFELDGDWQSAGQSPVAGKVQGSRSLRQIPRQGGIRLLGAQCKEIIIDLKSTGPLSGLSFYNLHGDHLDSRVEHLGDFARLIFPCTKLVSDNEPYLKIFADSDNFMVSAIYSR